MSNATKSFDNLTISLRILIRNYFNDLTKLLFSDLYLTKFLDLSTELFFSCKIIQMLCTFLIRKCYYVCARKNGFAEVSKNLTVYRCKKFVWIIKIIM